MNKIYDLIIKSLNGFGGKVSSTRIISYILLCVILLFSVTFLGLEITSAYLILVEGGKYVISNEIIIIFGMLFSNIIIMSGINKSKENKKGIDESPTPKSDDNPNI